MADYSELYFSNKKTSTRQGELNVSGSPYLLAKYHVPLFWLALFEREDIVDVRDDVWPHMVKSRLGAAALFSSRQAIMQRRFPSLRPQWHEQFKEFLLQVPFEYVHVDTSQIGSISSTAQEWRADIETMLGLFSERPTSPLSELLGKLYYKWAPNPGWELFQMRLGAAFKNADAETSWPYCGESGTDEPLPWEGSDDRGEGGTA